MYEIAFIAPNPALLAAAGEIIKEKDYPISLYLGDMEEGVQAARQALERGAKILISRGGTALRISGELNMEVIPVKPSLASILSYIHDRTGQDDRIAIVGFNPLIRLSSVVCDILGRTYAVFEINGVEDLQCNILKDVEAYRPDIVIGDTISTRLTIGSAREVHLIESTRESFLEAFEQAIWALNNVNKHTASANKLAMVLNCAQQGAMLLNGDGFVEEINEHGCELLGVTRSAVIHTRYETLLQAEELSHAVSAAQNVRNCLAQGNNRRFAVDLVVGPPRLEASSLVVLFQEVEQLQRMETNIRRKLFNKGFFARYTFTDIVCESQNMRSLIATAREYSKTACNIMIQGETGTGKELFAQSIHNAGPLSKGPFVAVNCAALPGSLLESELFGYAPGAFTGALRTGKMGLFELAHNGTLFLDEVSEMDVFLQSRLLRTLQFREIRRIGDDHIIPVNVRIIAATNRDPAREVERGKMRGDLFFRLNVLDLRVPPLRDRRGDPAMLFQHYLGIYCKKYGTSTPAPGKRFLQAVNAYPWPGNVRELENLSEKYVILHGLPEDALSLEKAAPFVPAWAGAQAPERPASVADVFSPDAAGGKDESLDEVIRGHVLRVFDLESGNISHTAARLGVDRNTVKRWLAKKV